MRRFVSIATLLLVAGVVFYFLLGTAPSNPGSAASSVPRTATASSTPRSSAPQVSPRRDPTTASNPRATSGDGVASSPDDFPIAASLNAPNSTIARDVDIVRQIFEAWLSNFPHEGNPVGENADITAALLGDNRLGLALIPKDHRALNSRGELCDRWGTPFRFHQLSGTKMEIRSAGQDRKFLTEDDVVWTPQ
jgi:hypothetical protein